MTVHMIHLAAVVAAIAGAVALARERCYFLAFCCLLLAFGMRSSQS